MKTVATICKIAEIRVQAHTSSVKASLTNSLKLGIPKKHALYGVQGDGDSDCRVYGENMEFPHQAAGKSTGKADDQEVLSSEQDDDWYVHQWACTASCGGMVFEAVKGSTKIYVDDVIKVRLKPAIFPEMPCPAGVRYEGVT